MTEPVVTMPSSSTRTPSVATTTSLLLLLPHDLQVHLLTFLRAFDLSALQQTCKYYANRELVHAVVITTAEQVYPADLTQGFAAASTTSGPPPLNSNSSSSLYTLAHLRNMEWLVVARILSRPEPRSGAGFYISKSWCRTALQWLEAQQHRQQQLLQQNQQQQQQGQHSGKKNKKLSRKQQKLQTRSSFKQQHHTTASTAGAAATAVLGPPEPWPDVNSDLLCCHDQLQRCSNSKSARARRRLVDKQAWKTIQKLYPHSTPLSAVQGECVHCRLETESKKREEEERLLQMKTQRKQPLNNPVLRRFYTRTRGVPTHCLKQFNQNSSNNLAINDNDEFNINDIDLEREAINLHTHNTGIPLIPGRYYILPRAWCQAWRRYMKTGDARGNTISAFAPSSQAPPAPDASAMLCDAHRVPVLPPHLEAYLYGQTNQLFASTRAPSSIAAAAADSAVVTPPPRQISRTSVVGMALPDLDPATLRQLQAAGLSPAELLAQRNAMLEIEHQQLQQQQRRRRLEQEQQQRPLSAVSSPAAMSSPLSKQECLDRENYIVVEILSEDEYVSLEALWPGSQSYDNDDADDDDSDNGSQRKRSPQTIVGTRGATIRGSRDCVPCQVWFDILSPSSTTCATDSTIRISFCASPCRECEASGICNSLSNSKLSSSSSSTKKMLKH